MYTIGVDIGGMSIKVGLVDENGNIVYKNKRETSRNPEVSIQNTIDQISEILSVKNLTVKDINGIGIGCPGFSNSETGMIDLFFNVGWKNVPFCKELKKHFDTKILISNDANVAILGEVLYGSAKNYKNCAMFTLGTGVGGGIVINGKLYEGYQSKGAELGHMTLIMDGIQCACGRKGCIEQYASATALIRQTKEAMLGDKNSKMWAFVDGDIDKVDGRTAFECAKSGDKTAEKVCDTYIKYLCEGIISILNIFRPEAFIIGGGISNQGDYLKNKVKAYCEKNKYGYEGAPKTEILIASLKNDAGIIGASALINQ